MYRDDSYIPILNIFSIKIFKINEFLPKNN
jgi:hypothetical protein